MLVDLYYDTELLCIQVQQHFCTGLHQSCSLTMHIREDNTHQTECQFTNPAIGGLITSYERMKLLGTLHSLQNSVLYYDTDSVMFVGGDKIEDSLPIAPYLGE